MMRKFFLGLAILLLIESSSVCAEEQFGSLGKDNGRLNVLLIFGMHTQWYLFDKVVSKMGPHQLKISDAPTSGVEYFPSTYEELFGYNIIILSNVTAGALGDYSIEMLYDYVKVGGGLLVMGGLYTYGEGELEKTKIRDLLPVEILGPFDLKWNKEGWMITQKGKNHPILQGLDFSEKPMVYWVHQTKAKPKATVLLEAGPHPCLVAWNYGKGRVVTFLGTPLGIAQEGQTPVWKWSGWEKLMENTLSWLAKK